MLDPNVTVTAIQIHLGRTRDRLEWHSLKPLESSSNRDESFASSSYFALK